jgi:hypothetical protein
MNNSSSNGPPTPSSDPEWNWDWLKHFEHLFTARSGLFLVAETALLGALAELLLPESSSSKDSWLSSSVGATLTICGIAISCFWLYVG